MSKRVWMPLNVGDYLQDTGHLTTIEHGAYMLLIMEYWKEGGLPTDERKLARIARLSADEWAAHRDAIADLFLDGWKHKRVEEELAKAADLIEKRRANASAQHQQRKSGADALHVHRTSSDAGVPPLTKNQDTSSLRSDVGARASKPTPRQHLETVLDTDHAGAVIEHRQRLRKALSERAAKMLAAELRKFPDPNAAADRMILKGWSSIDASWPEAMPRAGPQQQRPNPLSDAFGQMRGQDDRPSETVPDPVRYLPAASG